MTAETLLERTARDLPGRLRWRVMQRLNICPASLRGYLFGRRRALHFACQLVLDARNNGTSLQTGTNPNFDEERFWRLRRN